MPIAAAVDAHLQQSKLEQERSARFLNRASWAIVGVLGAFAASVWIAPIARATGHLGVVRALGIGAALEFFALIGLVVMLRRRLAAENIRADASHKVLSTQNDRLREQNAELEQQTQTAQEQAAELEIQATDLEAANEILIQSEARHRNLAEDLRLLTRRLGEAQHVAQLAYWEIDSATGDVYWSEEMYRLAGLDAGIQPPPTDRFLQAVHPDDRERMQSIATAAVRDPAEFTEQYRLILPGGPVRVVQAKARIIVDDRGAEKLVGTIQDITERVQLESQLRRSQKMEAVGQLAGGVAHDFNNVLTVIEGYTTLLLAGRPNDEERASLEEIRDAARRAATLTRQLLAFSRQQVLQPRILSVNTAIAGVEKMLGRLIGEHIEFYTRLAPSLDRVKADPGQLEQVLINLAVNARDAMVNGGVLTIETANVFLDAAYAKRYPSVRTGPYVMLAVTDTGTGIAAGDLERIFEPFFTTKEAGKGTGLGLSTVHGIVEQSGGHISVYTEPGRGTTFKVYLPRVEEEASALDPTTTAGAARRGTETILLVEDDPAVRTVAGAILRRAGYTVIEATDGVDALRLTQDTSVSFDLVLSDMVMPGLGGRQLASHLKRVRPNIPILLMSGYTRDAMIHNAELSSGGLFVEKPFTPDDLTQKVRAAIQGGGRAVD